MREVWEYRCLIFGINRNDAKVVWKRPYLRPLVIALFRLNLITGGGRTEDWLVTMRYWCAGSLEEHRALNS